MSTSRHRLAAILFADIKGYSALMEDSETNAMLVLDRYQEILEEKATLYNGEIVKSYGDGSLLLFTSTLDAVDCAIEMQTAFREEPVVPLRIGIHVGEVIDKGEDIFGNAVNIASRIESMGVAGGILFSGNVYEKIKNKDQYSIEAYGTREFHNIEEPLDIYAISNPGFQLPDKNNIQGKLKQKDSSKKSVLIGALVVLGLLISTSFLFRDYFKADPIPIVQGSKKSIAVLPFESLSTEQENQYFTDGMHDDLLTYLSKSKLLKVISRSSVTRLKDTDRSVDEIAELLDVTHLMEGSVRRIGNQVRINVQLVDALSDNNLWAENYEIDSVTTKNILQVQSDIAEKISNSLVQSVFSPGETSLPVEYTDNLDAYENYLKARQLKESGNRESLYEAKRLLEEAIVLDDQFAQAYVLLGNLYIHLVYYAGESPDSYFPKSWEFMEKSMELNSNLSEAYGLKGSLYHWWKREFAGAQEAYEKAIELNPNNDNALYGYAIAYQDLNMDFEKVDQLMPS